MRRPNRLVFFNNKGGVGNTSLVYHLAWMYGELGYRVVVADLDPQANITSTFLDEDRLEQFWPDGDHPLSILGCVSPIIKGIGDITPPYSEHISDNIFLIVGDLGLSSFEDELSLKWAQCGDGREAAFRVVSSFSRILDYAERRNDADLVLIDVGPNLGAINRSAIIAADYVVVPLAPDLFSLQGLQNLGPTLRQWRKEWKTRREQNPAADLHLPAGQMTPLGYVVMQHAVRLDRPVKAYQRWMERIPLEYRKSVLAEKGPSIPHYGSDEHRIAQIKHYRSLMPLAMEALKPMFLLKPADGAIGAQQEAVKECYMSFRNLAKQILLRIGILPKATA